LTIKIELKINADRLNDEEYIRMVANVARIKVLKELHNDRKIFNNK